MAPAFLNHAIFKPPPFDGYHFRSKIVRLKTSRGNTIATTMIKRRQNTTAITLLYSHANADDLNNSFAQMQLLAKKLNVNVVGYDYAGYGDSTGTPSEANCYADIESVFEYLIEERKIPVEHIVLFGRSLGSGPSCYLAAKCSADGKPVAGLILQSPFTSVFRLVVPDIGVTLMGDAFPNIDRIREIMESGADSSLPIFIAHGEADRVVPLRHGQTLRQAMPQRKVEFFSHPKMTHNDVTKEVELEMCKSMSDFLDYYILARRLWMTPAVARLHVCK